MLETIHIIFVIIILIFYGIMNFCVFFGPRKFVFRKIYGKLFGGK